MSPFKVSKVGDHSRGWPEGSLFDSLLHQCVGEGANPFPGLLHFTLDPYLIILSVKQGGIKYHFLSLWYDSTWDWTQVSRAIGERLPLVEGYPKAPFSIATPPRCQGGCYSFTWIAPLYPWSLPYNAEC